MYLDATGISAQSKFRVPYVNGKYLIGLGFLLFFGYALYACGLVTAVEEKPLLFVFWTTWAVL